MPSSLNFAVTDGRVVIATRYRDSKYAPHDTTRHDTTTGGSSLTSSGRAVRCASYREQDPPSLYYSEAQQMIDEDGAASPMCWKYPSKRLVRVSTPRFPLSPPRLTWRTRHSHHRTHDTRHTTHT
jgi:hypothetical protein